MENIQMKKKNVRITSVSRQVTFVILYLPQIIKTCNWISISILIELCKKYIFEISNPE